jgi:hypothetical protein
VRDKFKDQANNQRTISRTEFRTSYSQKLQRTHSGGWGSWFALFKLLDGYLSWALLIAIRTDQDSKKFNIT